MNPPVILALPTIRAAALAGRIKWRYHALLRAHQRGITRAQALQVLRTGETIERRPRAKPYPRCLLMAMVEPHRPLYVAVAYDRGRDYLHVITVHWLDPRKLEDPWTRKP
ncbi:MAG: DUF4258 domain-containing protein, partial [Deltaproteobacteria bacterium]|nr:DUF4258 domain-containing protein [Deltaproteobacteria bacterium]